MAEADFPRLRCKSNNSNADVIFRKDNPFRRSNKSPQPLIALVRAIDYVHEQSARTHLRPLSEMETVLSVRGRERPLAKIGVVWRLTQAQE